MTSIIYHRFCCISCHLISRVRLMSHSLSSRGHFSPSDVLLSPFLLITSNHFAYPGAEGGHFGVDARRLLCPAGMTPGRDPVNHPTTPRTLTHERTSTVTSATVHTPLGMNTTSAEHAAREGTLEMLLAVAAGQQRDGGLLQRLGVWATWQEWRGQRLNWEGLKECVCVSECVY